MMICSDGRVPPSWTVLPMPIQAPSPFPGSGPRLPHAKPPPALQALLSQLGRVFIMTQVLSAGPVHCHQLLVLTRMLAET